MTASVQTVLGRVPVDELGVVLMHEHLKVSYPGWEVDSTLRFERERELEAAVARLARLRELGVRTFVDPCPIELARDPEFMADAARGSGLHVICSTGLYIEQGLELAGFPPYFRVMSIDEIERVYTTELREGIGPRRIRPGILKCATGPHQLGPNEAKALRAAARTALALDVRITTHTTLGTLGPEQLDLLLGEGVPAHWIAIGHCDWNPDTAYHRALLERGCYVGFDTIGAEAVAPDEVRLKNLAELIGAGFARQLFLSHDHIGCWHFRPGGEPELVRALQSAPQRRYTYLFEEFLPRLRRAGVREDAIETLLVANPRRYFAGEPL